MSFPINPFVLSETPTSGINLIEASAGTGKTYTIEGVFLRLILEKGCTIDQILVVTYTEAATSELRERIRGKIRAAQQAFERGDSEDEFLNYLIEQHAGENGDLSLSVRKFTSALSSFDEASIFTIHSFCQKMLLDYAFESQSQFDTTLIKDQGDLIEELATDFWRKLFYTEIEEFVAFLLQRYATPEKFTANLDQILAKPIKNFLTGLDHYDTQKWFQSAQSSYQQLLREWAKSRAEIEHTLIKDPALNHRSYSSRHVPNWMGKLDIYFEQENFADLPDCLDKFFPKTLEMQTKAGKTTPQHLIFSLCEALHREVESIAIALHFEFIHYAQKSLKHRKQDRNLRSFDDLIKDLQESLHGDAGEELANKIRKKYPVALIDEFQDTDPIQYQIFHRVFAHEGTDLFFIGDPKQSIYNFRGADIFAYMEAQGQADHLYTLDTNWRSDQDLVEAVNFIFNFRQNSFVFDRIQFSPSKGAEKNEKRSLQIAGEYPSPFHFWYLDHPEGENPGKAIPKSQAQESIILAVASEIVSLLNYGKKGLATIQEKPVMPKDIAILVRTHQEAHLMQSVLKQVGVPSVLNTKASIFDSNEFQEIKRIAKAIAYYGRETLVKVALVTDILGYSGNELYSLTENEERWESKLEQFRYYHELWNNKGFYSMSRQLMSRDHVRSRLLRYPDGERRLTNVLQVLEVFHEIENKKKLGMAGLVKWAFSDRVDKEVKDENHIRLETDEEALKILTIHTSKGLEFPIVFCPFSWYRRELKDQEVFFHDPQREEKLVLDLGSPDFEIHKELAEKEALAEDLRLLYVAVTRGKHRCYLVCGRLNKSESSGLSYLLHDFKEQGLKLKDADLRKDLSRLAEQSKETISVSDLPQLNGAYYQAPKNSSGVLGCSSFQGDLSVDWGLSSFTSLSRKSLGKSSEEIEEKITEVESPDRDFQDNLPNLDELLMEEGEEEELSIFTLPRGANTGICIHEILEELDFQERENQVAQNLVLDKLKKYALEPKWEPIIMQMLRHVLTAKLPLNNSTEVMKLRQLSITDGIPEMEFYFPIQNLKTKEFRQVIEEVLGPNQKAHPLLQTLNRLDVNETQGFMKGFMDYVFCYEGRYYILDWKTNYLGSQIESYHQDSLRDYMIKSSFVLQYYLYTLAVHKFLKLRIPNYNFDTHFGGIFYLFIRGIDSHQEELYGIYYDFFKNEKELIERLDLYFTRG